MPTIKSIAVVESTPKFSDIIRPAIDQALGHTHQLETAKDCLQNLNHSAYLVDLMLEDVDGLSLIEDIRFKGGKMPVVAFMNTNSMNELDMEEQGLRKMALDAGANALFLAPFNLCELVQTLQRLCSQSPEVNEQSAQESASPAVA
jgi:DNA-binding response OmpR family regulator